MSPEAAKQIEALPSLPPAEAARASVHLAQQETGRQFTREELARGARLLRTLSDELARLADEQQADTSELARSEATGAP